MKNIGYIYSITNIINNKIYIGQTASKRGPLDRWKTHLSAVRCNKIKNYLYPSIRKYGEQKFKFEIIKKCKIEDLNNEEMFYIKHYNSNNKNYGYNLSIGGDNSNNSKSLKARRKISKSKTGISTGPCSKEKALAISKAKLASGYTHSKKTRAKISKNRKKIEKLPDEWRKKISMGLKKTAIYKFSLNQVKLILKDLKKKLTIKLICEKYKITRKTIWSIERNLYGPDSYKEYLNKNMQFKKLIKRICCNN